jgi:hypothetical protein
VLSIPSGTRIRSRVNASQVVPASSPARIPAVMTIRFWYWNRVRMEAEGWRYCRRSYISWRVKPEPYHIRSWRGRPERWVTRSRGVIRRVAVSSCSLKSGR